MDENMTDREKKIAEIYRRIKKITGLKFDEKDADEGTGCQ